MDSTIPLSEFIPPPTEINDTHKVYSIAIAYILLALLTCLVVVTRLAYRFRKNNLGIDDYVIIPSLVSLIKLPICNNFFFGSETLCRYSILAGPSSSCISS